MQEQNWFNSHASKLIPAVLYIELVVHDGDVHHDKLQNLISEGMYVGMLSTHM